MRCKNKLKNKNFIKNSFCIKFENFKSIKVLNISRNWCRECYCEMRRGIPWKDKYQGRLTRMSAAENTSMDDEGPHKFESSQLFNI